MTARRDFLGWLGASSLLATVGAPAAAHAETPALSPVRRPVSVAWDMSWFDKLQGKQVAVFDSPEVAEGAALFRAIYWRKQVTEVYGTPASAMVPVVVFRHSGIPLVMNDAFWTRYQIGKELKLKDPATKKWSLVNPLSSAPAGTPPQYAEINIPAFIAAGGIVLACNMAFAQCVGRIQEKEKLSHDDATTRAKEMLVPGVILQPSGFFALMKAQETGGGYMVAS